MKKFPGISLTLTILLVFQMVCFPALATQVEETNSALSESIADPSQETGISPEQESLYSGSDEGSLSGDVSVNSGCNSINAVTTMMNGNELEVEAGAALMYEMNTGTLLYAYNADTKMYPASVTKVMTCLIALEHGNMDDIVTVSESVVANRDPSGSNCALVAGEQISLRELIYCLMVASANDAGSAISEYIAGSEEAFVELMNQKAAELGCSNTHFVNPHGLHDEQHYTTARDLAKIMLAALEHELFREVYSTKLHEVPATNMSEARSLISTNYMIEKSVVDYYYDQRVVGGKTGFTTPAGRCLAAVSESGGMKLLTVVMGGVTELNDNGSVKYGSFEQTGKLIDYGFENFVSAQILSPDAVLTAFPVTGGANNIQAAVKQAVGSAIPIGTQNDQLRYEYVLDDGTLTAPVEAGEALGVVRVWYQSKCVAQAEIYAVTGSAVKQTQAAEDPAVGNTEVQEDRDIWHIVLVVVLVLLAMIVVMLVISTVRSAMIRARRKKRRQNHRRSR